MNISPVNGYDVKHSASEKLQNEVNEFLENGGVISEIRGFGYKREVVQEFSYNNGSNKNKQHRQEMLDRQVYQVPVLKNYYKIVGRKNCWAVLIKKIGGIVSNSQLVETMSGKGSIANEKTWNAIVVAIDEIISNHEDLPDSDQALREKLKSKGVVCRKKIARICDQYYVLKAYLEKFPSDLGFNILSAKAKGIVSPSHLRHCAKAETSIANAEKWEMINKNILELMKDVK